MPAILANANKFLLSTDWPREKVVGSWTGSAVIRNHPTHADAQLLTIPHRLAGLSPLCRGAYRYTLTSLSYTSPWYQFDSSPVMSESLSGTLNWFPIFLNAVYSDNSNVYVYFFNHGPDVTVEYRILGIMNDTQDVDVASTSALNQKMTLNSDNNYLKTVATGGATVTPSPGNPANIVVNHGLGYVPQYQIWTIYNGKWGKAGTENYIGAGSLDVSTSVTNQNMVLTINAFLGPEVVAYAYRIFGDD